MEILAPSAPPILKPLWKAHDCPSAFRRFSGASMEHFQYAAITWIY